MPLCDLLLGMSIRSITDTEVPSIATSGSNEDTILLGWVDTIQLIG